MDEERPPEGHQGNYPPSNSGREYNRPPSSREGGGYRTPPHDVYSNGGGRGGRSHRNNTVREGEGQGGGEGQEVGDQVPCDTQVVCGVCCSSGSAEEAQSADVVVQVQGVWVSGSWLEGASCTVKLTWCLTGLVKQAVRKVLPCTCPSDRGSAYLAE